MSDYQKPLTRAPRTLSKEEEAAQLATRLDSMAKRFNSGKIRPSLFPVEVLEEILKILEMGAKKYGDGNWKKGRPWMDTVDSLERHLMDFKKGIDLDEESKCLNMAHVLVNASFLVYYQLKEMKELDDRGTK